MIDLNEPVRPSYSQKEATEVRKNFYILVHNFLFIYLALHNLLIPLVVNLFKGQHLLSEVHFWFLIQVPVALGLRRGQGLSSNLMIFILMGSVTRLGYYSFFAYSKSWSMVSIYLSEFSTLLFCLIIWNELKRNRFQVLALGGILITPLLGMAEYTTPHREAGRSVLKRDLSRYEKEGCAGSLVRLHFPNPSLPLPKTTASIVECGFEEKLLHYQRELQLQNNSSSSLNLRLYELVRKDRRYTWKFLRMKRLEVGESWGLSDFLKRNKTFIIKSPERRSIGALVLVPSESELSGEFEITSDTLNWEKSS